MECLEAEGVKHVFGIPGEETLDLNDDGRDHSGDRPDDHSPPTGGPVAGDARHEPPHDRPDEGHEEDLHGRIQFSVPWPSSTDATRGRLSTPSTRSTTSARTR